MTAFGALIFPADYAIDPATLAKAAEARGFESLFFPEHTHIPASRESAWPGGGELPDFYWRSHDPFVGLAMAAAVTEQLKLGTGIALITERDPILMAKQVASLDRLSGGRLLLGVGAGWNAEEMANHGVPFKDRWKILRERIQAMQAIWTEEEAEYHGQFVDFDPVWSHPKPAQAGGPPILLGASSRYTWDRIGEFGHGWFPIYQTALRSDAQGAMDYAAGIAATRDAWTRHGRSGEPDFSIFGMVPKADEVQRFIDMGFNRIIFGLPAADADTVMPVLDRCAELAHQFA